jgi:uncharacterized FAD-dependent dehydrogenase
VVAATSEPSRVVTNGMSQYSRNERNANAGIVVGITPEADPRHSLRYAFNFSTRSFAGVNTNALPIRSLRINLSFTSARRSERAV